MQNLDWVTIGHDSSTINRIAHDGNDLYVEFKHGNSGYRYADVPYDTYKRILNKECISKSEGKPSYGSTLDKLVKKEGYKYKQYK